MKKKIGIFVMVCFLLLTWQTPAPTQFPVPVPKLPNLDFLGDGKIAMAVQKILEKMYKLDKENLKFTKEIHDYMTKTRSKIDSLRENDLYSGYMVYKVITSGYPSMVAKQSIHYNLNFVLQEIGLTKYTIDNLFKRPSWRGWLNKQYVELIYKRGSLPEDVGLTTEEIWQHIEELRKDAYEKDKQRLEQLEKYARKIRLSVAKSNLKEVRGISKGEKKSHYEERKEDLKNKAKLLGVAELEKIMEEVKKNQAEKIKVAQVLAKKLGGQRDKETMEKYGKFVAVNFASSSSSFSFFSSNIFDKLRIIKIIPYFKDKFGSLAKGNKAISERAIYTPFIRAYTPMFYMAGGVVYFVMLWVFIKVLLHLAFSEDGSGVMHTLLENWLLAIMVVTYPVWMVLLNDLITVVISKVGNFDVIVFYQELEKIFTKRIRDINFTPSAEGLEWSIESLISVIVTAILSVVYIIATGVIGILVTLIIIGFAVFIFVIQGIIFVIGQFFLILALYEKKAVLNWVRKVITARVWELVFIIISSIYLVFIKGSFSRVNLISTKFTGIEELSAEIFMLLLASFLYSVFVVLIFIISEWLAPSGMSAAGNPFVKTVDNIKEGMKSSLSFAITSTGSILAGAKNLPSYEAIQAESQARDI